VLFQAETLPEFGWARDNVRVIHDIQDYGSVARFLGLTDAFRGFYATCDDDLEYPANYIQYMKSKVEEYKRKAVVTMHGRLINTPMISFQGTGVNKTRENIPCLKYSEKDKEVHIGGTGCMMLHTDTLRFSVQDFKHRNLDDVEFSILAQKRHVPIIAVAHEPLKYLNPPIEDTIWYKETIRSKELLDLVNSHKWQLWGS
jgi:hypothetical protein